MRLVILALLTSVCPLIAQEHSDHHAPVVGHVDFRNSGNPASQEPFERGVALLHSFDYKKAAIAFKEAERVDPSLAIAYWLEALTYSHVLWGEEDLPAARAALARLGATRDERLQKAKTPRERSYGDAIESFFMDAPLPQRAKLYAEGIVTLATSDTTDLEASAFGAHALMMQRMTGRPAGREMVDQARALAERVFARNPQHPGAAHYMTHVTDMDPKLASSQLEAARAYDKIAPDVTHALHMPSHVYLPLGLWAELVSSNERAWAASRKEGTPGWHALEWLQYGYLEQGRFKEAHAIIDTASKVLKTVANAGDRDGQFALDQLRFAYAMESGDWRDGDIPDGEDLLRMPAPSQRFYGMATTSAYHSAIRSIMSGKLDAGARVSKAMRARADTISSAPRKAALLRLADQIDAVTVWKSGDTDRAIVLLQDLAKRDGQAASMPPVTIPVNELLGDLLLLQGRKAEAAAAYQAALEVRTNRRHATDGLASARK